MEKEMLGSIEPRPEEYKWRPKQKKKLVNPYMPENRKSLQWIGRVTESNLRGFYNRGSEESNWWVEISVTAHKAVNSREVTISVPFIPEVLEDASGDIYVSVYMDKQRTRIGRISEEILERTVITVHDVGIRQVVPMRIRKLIVGEPIFDRDGFVKETVRTVKEPVDSKKARELSEFAAKVPAYYLNQVITNDKLREQLVSAPEKVQRRVAKRISKEYSKEFYIIGSEEPVKVRATGKISDFLDNNGMLVRNAP